MKQDKPNMISPYLCKHEGELSNIEKSLKKLDEKIDILIQINSELNVQAERINNLEKRTNEITTKLWYVCGGTILAIIGAIIQMIN